MLLQSELLHKDTSILNVYNYIYREACALAELLYWREFGEYFPATTAGFADEYGKHVIC